MHLESHPSIDGLQHHPMLQALYDEMHSRPFQVIPSPARITHLAILCDDEQSERQFKQLRRLYAHFGEVPPEYDEVCIQQDFGDFRIRREKHMEFVSYTFINFAVPDDGPFDTTGLAPLPDGWIEALPGVVISAFHIGIKNVTVEGQQLLNHVKDHFEDMRLVSSAPQHGDARMWTTFQMHSDGFGRFLVCNRNMSPSQLGRLTQRLIEIETYRLMTLLGLEPARECSSQLTAMDRQLARLTQRLADHEEENAEQILAELTDMAARVEAFRARTSFRFSATVAYHSLVLARLEALREDEVSGHLTLTEFITRRLTPAVSTCEAVGGRLENLSRRIDRVSDMMRTRVELGIQAQNQELLTSMDRRSKIQLMMQHTVEGLSVAAISYYSVGLVKYLLDAAGKAGVEINQPLVMGAAVPVIIGGVWFAMRRIHAKFHALEDETQLEKE